MKKIIMQMNTFSMPEFLHRGIPKVIVRKSMESYPASLKLPYKAACQAREDMADLHRMWAFANAINNPLWQMRGRRVTRQRRRM